MVAEPQGGPTVDSSVDQHAIRQSTDTSHLYKNTFVWNPRQQPERVEAFQAQNKMNFYYNIIHILKRLKIPGNAAKIYIYLLKNGQQNG